MAIEKVTTKITKDALRRLQEISAKTGLKMYSILDRLIWDEHIRVNKENEPKIKGKKQ